MEAGWSDTATYKGRQWPLEAGGAGHTHPHDVWKEMEQSITFCELRLVSDCNLQNCMITMPVLTSEYKTTCQDIKRDTCVNYICLEHCSK